MCSRWTSQENIPRVASRSIDPAVPDGHASTPTPRGAQLHALPTGIGVKPPYARVGHSWRGLLLRVFAATYPEGVAGLVYVDRPGLRSLEQNLACLQARLIVSKGTAS